MSSITHISQLDLNKSYTVADYLSWRFDEMVELIKGRIYKMSPAPRNIHQQTAWNLSYEIGKLVKKSPCRAYHAPFDVYLFGDNLDKTTVVQPDICIVCDRGKLQDKGCVGAPDLVVEILSPSTLKKDLDYKFHLYEEAGVKEYWIVAPEYKQVSIYFLDSAGKYEHKGDFTNEDDIPVFIWNDVKIKGEDVFEE